MAREVLYGLTFTATDKMSPVFAKIGQGAKKLEGAFESVATSGASVASLAGPVGAAIAGIAIAATAGAVAVVKFGQALAGWAGAAAKVEAIEIRTLSAIRERADFTDEEFEALKRLNGERERTLGIDADAQLQLQGTLASMGVHKDQLDAATKATIGLSTATGQGLNEAAKVVAKSLAGNTGALQEYGIKVSSVKEAQGKFEQMFAVAAAQADTYGTRVQALGHSWDGLFEAIGRVIIQNPEVNKALNAIIAGVVSLTERFGPGSKSAEAFGSLVSRVFKLVGSTATVAAKVVGNAFRYIDFFYNSPMFKQLATDLEGSARDLNMVLAGGQSVADAAATAAASAAESYLEALQSAEYYKRELASLRAEQAAGRLTADEATEAFKINAFELGAAQVKMRDLEEWARKTHGTLNVLGTAAAKAAREVRQVGEAARVKPTEIGEPPKTTSGKPKDAAPAGETFEQFAARMRKANALAREAAAIRGNYLAEQERENQQRVLEIQAAYQDEQDKQRQAALEATAEAARSQAEEIRSFLQNIGAQAVNIFGDAFSSIGRLQNETVTEIVRNEEGMLEERTRITGQYIATVGDALKQFLGDTAEMFGKAALHFIAMKAVEAMVSAIASSFSTLGIFALIGGAAIGAAAYGMVKSASAKMPQPPKFHTGGVVPGVPGRERMALLQSGERVSSVADTADGRGGMGGSITINNNLLVAPSRVQVERVNRDVLLPSARRLQRLGFAG